ncbi:SLC13 family permease [Pleionea mediterranea]|uniref:Sodium-dependent dicarboxylate transporter 2/3/5 n=1 Tax=Pleionea mediterranea TaxID=523701 RepID=A0A316FM98_9GAMM|nr:SLC13 family permease [Pleionea mediterranea]PWK49252.1 sodium-dependent dicarboxylate transporter 2/3/5 [Pleionea mediterranea]
MTEQLSNTGKNKFSIIQQLALITGPLVCLVVTLILANTDFGFAMGLTLGVTLWCAIWWITEPVPIAATSLLPLALFPLFGVLNSKQVAQSYGHSLILLLMGGFMLSKAMEKSGTHRRIALQMIHLFGGKSSSQVLLGFMVASALLSMWISNTATTLMLLPVALAVLEKNTDRTLVPALLLGTAYAASIGGIGTPIGTPPNMLFRGVYEEATGQSLSFTEWMSWAVPVVVVLIPLAWLWLRKGLSASNNLEVPHPGHWRTEEIRVLTVFAITALLWITRKEPFGGWSSWFDLKTANDASVALLAAAVMFMLPNGKGERLLDWETANKIPWGVLILFGGGICIAKAFAESGLSQVAGEHLTVLINQPLWLLVPLICLSVTFITEVTSNTATTTLLMPILAAAGIAAGIDPAIIMVPAAMSASCAFMLPVATAPNAVVFGSEKLTVRQMASKGMTLNFVGVVVISGSCLLLLS